MIRARLGALAACAGLLVLVVPSATAQAPPPRRGVLVIDVPGASFEELVGLPPVAALARAGGAGVLANAGDVVLPGDPDDPGSRPGDGVTFHRFPVGAPSLPDDVERAIASFRAREALVIVLSSEPSEAMRRAGDELVPIVLAVGAPAGLISAEGRARALTSDSTRRDGVVTGGDVAATVGAYLDPDGDPDDGGAPIEVVDAAAPFGLHERYLQQRRLYVPIGTAAALFATVVGLAAIAFLALRRVVPAPWRRATAWATVSVPMLATGMLAAGHLPELTYATAVPMVAIVAVFGTMAFSPLERRDPALVPAGIGLAVLVLAVVEAGTGWSGMLTPLLGGSQLDGGRFFGLPNVGIGLLVGAALWVAQRLRVWQGFALLCGVGLFAGLPLLGSNLGGAVTGFAAAGLWLAVRERRRLGALRGVAAVALVTIAGTAAILVAHAISPVETHVSRFEETAGGLGGILERVADRLEVGVDLIARSPAALVPVLGLPVVLAVVLRPPAAIRASFAGRPAWRDAVLVTILSGIVAYVVNDSGPAAAGLAFGLGLGGMLGVSLLVSARKMGAS